MAEAAFSNSEAQKFSSPNEEIEFLRARVADQEKKYLEKFNNIDRESVIREEVRKYAKANPDSVLEKGYGMLHTEAKEITLELSPETHDRKMEELLAILSEKGMKNALEVVRLMASPHIEDDFHRFLVQYIRAGLPMPADAMGGRSYRALKRALYEVSLPGKKDEDGSGREKEVKQMLSSMEQLYAGLLSLAKDRDDAFAIEIANPEGSEEVAFFVSVPIDKKELFEKQILSVFPRAKLFEKKDDYNIFNYDGVATAMEGSILDNPLYPIKTYDKFDFDPLHIIMNAFSKIDKNGEGVALQIVMRPDFENYLEHYKAALRDLEKGEKAHIATDVRHTMGGHFLKTAKLLAGEAVREIFSPKSGSEKAEPNKRAEENKTMIEEIREKISSPILHANLRIVASAKSRERAEKIAYEISSSFNQFENTQGAKIKFAPVAEKNVVDYVKKFVYRSFEESEDMPLSIKEAVGFMHFPSSEILSREVKTSKAATASLPVGLPTKGTLLGINVDRNVSSNVFITPEDRLRHFYAIGQTGTGKTTLLKNMIAQDIINGEGVCMIDPHGSDIQDILSIIPRERYEDVIYFDPGYTERPMALNMLEYDPRFPEQKTFVVNEMLSIFNKLFDMKVAGGPMFEQYFRNAVLLVMEDPASGNTLLDVSRVLSNKPFRELKLASCKNPIVVQFWKEIADKAGGEASLQNVVPYITSKFDVFLANDIMRPIISQEHSTFNFREVMDKKKILLVNLSKGRLGDINANLIGLILVGKILMAALSRADSFGADLPPFYLYIDEFQNITTDSISQILSEARKYKLSLTIAHQFIAQLEDDIKDAVFGNVGSIASFRVGADDAEYLAKQFEPVFTENDLLNLDNRNCYMKLLSGGRPVRPFSMQTLPPEKGDTGVVEKLKELSYLTYGKERSLIEEEIAVKYRKETLPK
ncbi:MAG: TraM recognition domain-containing protein [Patescibacteria group bacterium]